jgi:hypothetical protein
MSCRIQGVSKSAQIVNGESARKPITGTFTFAPTSSASVTARDEVATPEDEDEDTEETLRRQNSQIAQEKKDREEKRRCGRGSLRVRIRVDPVTKSPKLVLVLSGDPGCVRALAHIYPVFLRLCGRVDVGPTHVHPRTKYATAFGSQTR